MKAFNVENIPSAIREFIYKNHEDGFRFCLVGGYVRDWALGKESFDFDFEIRHINGLSGEPWIQFLKESFPNGTYIGMGVIRIAIGDLEIELSSPRTERFDGGLGHKNFAPNFDSQLDYEQSFQRRDLRINAIGLEFNLVQGILKADIVDPYEGLKEIEEGVISHISDDFFKDPVRLLRAIRFSINTEFELLLSESYELFNLTKLTQYYFHYEASKCKNQKLFVQKLIQVINDYDIKLPQLLDPIKLFKNESLLKNVTTYQDTLLFDLDIIDDGPFRFLCIKKSLYGPICRLKAIIKKLKNEFDDESGMEFLNAVTRIKTDENFIYFELVSELAVALDGVQNKHQRRDILHGHLPKLAELFA